MRDKDPMRPTLFLVWPRTRHPALVRYGVTLLIVGIAFLLRLALSGELAHYPLLLFIPAIFLAALLFGRALGFFATFASAVLAAYFFIGPEGPLQALRNQAFPLAVYLLIGILISAITEELHRAVNELSRSESEKTLLLEELNHRTRNNLMLLSSLLSLQARGSDAPDVREALESAVRRISAVAQAQERLHVADRHGRIELAGYLTELCTNLGNLLRHVRPIAVRVQAQPMETDPSIACSIGLMVNELVTNCFKYAFPHAEGGTVLVSFTSTPKEMLLTVEDDGVGCPPGAGAGTGSRLVSLLAAQYAGEVERQPLPKGCRVCVTLRTNGEPKPRAR
jgi:two-component sensor histidine kinase